MTTPDEEHRDLQQQLDEAGRWCQPRHAGWATLQARLGQPRSGRDGGTHPAEHGRSDRVNRRHRRLALAGAACVSAALVVVAALLVRPAAPRAPMAEAPPATQQPLFRIALAADCRIEPVGDALYEVVEPRRVRLEHGELYVSVGAEAVPHDPFIVETPAGEARSTASSFVVDTRSVAPEPQPTSTKLDAIATPPFGGVRFLTQVLVLAGAVQLVGAELNMEGRSGEVLAAETTPPTKPVERLSIPGFWILASPQTAEEVGLNEEQKAQLRAVADAYHQSMRSVRINFQEVPVEKRQEKIFEIQQTTREAARSAYQQTRGVLTAEQIDRLKTLQLRSSGWAYLQSDHYYERLGITAEQKAKLAAVVAEMQRKSAAIQDEMRQARADSLEKALEILDPDQLEKLKELGIGQQFWDPSHAGTSGERQQ